MVFFDTGVSRVAREGLENWEVLAELGLASRSLRLKYAAIEIDLGSTFVS